MNSLFAGVGFLVLSFFLLRASGRRWILFRYNRRAQRALAPEPVREIRSATKGWATVSGFVERITWMESPLEHRACVYWRVRVTRTRGDEKRLFGEYLSHRVFIVRDTTGRVALIPTESMLLTEDSFTLARETLNPAERELIEPFAESGLERLSRRWRGWSAPTYSEFFLSEGDPIRAFGFLLPSAELPASGSTPWSMVGFERRPLLIWKELGSDSMSPPHFLTLSSAWKTQSLSLVLIGIILLAISMITIRNVMTSAPLSKSVGRATAEVRHLKRAVHHLLPNHE